MESGITFTSKSVYQGHFQAKVSSSLAEGIWKPWAPLRCKIGVWLFLKGRVWTADILAKREVHHIEHCVFCYTIAESAQHLFIGCAVVNIIWGVILNWISLSVHGGNLRDRTFQEQVKAAWIYL
jgi:hypothetical protein